MSLTIFVKVEIITPNRNIVNVPSNSRKFVLNLDPIEYSTLKQQTEIIDPFFQKKEKKKRLIVILYFQEYFSRNEPDGALSLLRIIALLQIVYEINLRSHASAAIVSERAFSSDQTRLVAHVSQNQGEAAGKARWISTVVFRCEPGPPRVDSLSLVPRAPSLFRRVFDTTPRGVLTFQTSLLFATQGHVAQGGSG